MAIAGLHGLQRAQISFITITQLVFFLITVFENRKKRIFRSFWLEMKLLFQELAILVFLVVLCVFSLQQKQDIISSRLSWGLEFVVIITVTIAITCEALLMVYRMYEIPKAALLKVKQHMSKIDRSS